MDVEKKCLTCGALFRVPKAREMTATTCSQPCRGVQIAKRYARQRAVVKCVGCGNTFTVPPSHAARRIYCSMKCALPSRSHGPDGEKHYRWSGGKHLHGDGYLYISVPGHPFGTRSDYVFEHRVVMETWMKELAPSHKFLVDAEGGKYLSPEIAVHHINGDKRDNRPANLLACTNGAHRDIHNGVAPMEGEVWPEIRGLKPYEPRKIECVCQTCKQTFLAKRSTVRRGGGKFCTRKCYNLRERTTYHAIPNMEK